MQTVHTIFNVKSLMTSNIVADCIRQELIKYVRCWYQWLTVSISYIQCSMHIGNKGVCTLDGECEVIWIDREASAFSIE